MKQNVLVTILLLIFVSVGSTVSGASTAVSPISQGASNEIYLSAIMTAGSRVSDPDITYGHPAIDFGQVSVGNQEDRTITLTNEGLQTLTVNTLSTSNVRFEIISPTTTPFNLTTGQTKDVTVRYTPISEGSSAGSLVITSNDPDETAVSLTLTGEGTSPPADIGLVVSSLDFGEVEVGNSSDLGLLINNEGEEPLTITGLSITDNQFSIQSPGVPVTIAAGGSQNVTVRFAPTSEGDASAQLNISSDDPDEPTVSVSLSGEGIPLTMAGPEITVDMASLDFGDQLINTTESIIFTITNVGDETLNVSSIGITNTTYSVLSPSAPFSISAGNSQQVEVQFAPTNPGMEVGDLILNNNDADEGAFPVALFGEGVAPEIDSDETAVAFGNVDINSSTTASVVITNTGGYTLTLTSFTTTNSTYSVTSPAAPVDIAASGTQEVIIEFDPTAVQNESGELQIGNTDSDENPYIITLNGDGVDLANQVYEDATSVFATTPTHTLHATECLAPPIGSGSAWGDYDNDGDIDVYMTNHGGDNYLYRNDGDNGDADALPNFTDVAGTLGVQNSSVLSLSAVFIDYDNDGDQDLYVTNLTANTLYQNQLIESGNATFTDVTSAAGVVDFGRGITTAWADYDQDGDLDFYIGKHRQCSSNDNSRDSLYENNGDGTFSLANSYMCGGNNTTCAALEGLAFSPGWFDYDSDGDLDLYVVNDDIGGTYEENVMWRNDGPDGSGGWSFTDVSAATNTDISANGMGLAFGDYDNDSDFDIAFSNQFPAYLLEYNNGSFADRSDASGVDGATDEVTWGTIFLDYDNDRDVDLYFAAGTIQVQVGDVPNYLLRNEGDKTFTDVSAGSGADDGGRGRSTSYVDFDGDGWMDILVGNYGTEYVLYRNVSGDNGNTNKSLSFTFEGTDSNRDGIGTHISVTAGGVTQIRELSSGPSHGGGDQRIAHFGIGGSTRGQVRVTWPNGEFQDLGNFDVIDGVYHLVEPSIDAADIDVPVTVDFEDVETNTERDKQVSIENTGTMTLTISSLTTTDSVYTVQTGTPIEIAPGGSANVVVRYGPISDGTDDADLTIVSNDPDEGTVTVSLTGTGTTPSSTSFADVTAVSGIVQSHTLDGSICSPPVGSGSAWADYDNDGDIDAYVTNHGAANHLYSNNGDGTFTDTAVSLGLDDVAGIGHAANFIDYDNDGDQDLFVSNWGSLHLYENGLVPNGTVSFTDVAASAGLVDDGRTVTAAWADFDNDGYLDVYIAKHAYCGGSDPRNQDKLFHSNGDGTFTDRTAWLCTNCDPIDHALGFAAGWFDYDNDGDLDLYVVNDILQGDGSGGEENYRNVLWRNDGSDGSGGWTFTDQSAAAGVDKAVNGMGLGIGDYNNDGDYDIAFSDIGASTLYGNNGDSTFDDVSWDAGAATGSLTWGTAFFDYNNDGWLDLYFISGLIGSGGVTPNIFLQNNQNGTFSDISVNSGLNDDGRGRHAAIVDFNLDGLMDVFVGNYGEAPVLYENQVDSQGNNNNWVGVTVQGTDSNRDGIGTKLTFTAGGITQIRTVNSGPTHGGGDHRAVVFGMGSNTTGTLVIDWPNGEQESITINSGDVDQYIHYTEPMAP